MLNNLNKYFYLLKIYNKYKYNFIFIKQEIIFSFV